MRCTRPIALKPRRPGLLWGAYHFGTGADGTAQAQHFLDLVGTFDNTLLVLDFEQNPGGDSMTLQQARDFVIQVNKVTGWQYTDGTSGPQPHTVAGIGNCDPDKFNGAEDQLRALWQGSPSS